MGPEHISFVRKMNAEVFGLGSSQESRPNIPHSVPTGSFPVQKIALASLSWVRKSNTSAMKKDLVNQVKNKIYFKYPIKVSLERGKIAANSNVKS